jgi:hypothetical protein
MNQQSRRRNYVTISMPGGRSVPIVSQTENDLMKTAIFPHARARHDDGAHRAPGGSCPHGFLASGSFCMPSSGAQDAIAKPPNGTCPWGWVASGSY